MLLYLLMSLNSLLDERGLLLLIFLHLIHFLSEVRLYLPTTDQLLIGLLDTIV